MSTPATLFIDGAWVPASDGGTREIRNPADGELVAVVSEATAQDTGRPLPQPGPRSTAASGRPFRPRSAATSCSGSQPS